ncbi:MAG: hypothetical protein DMG38_25030 [Acidobacteria bacterium]|nr:MAG: hypothetical protein DMG38_25030 [Acidobacteriota bacterium]
MRRQKFLQPTPSRLGIPRSPCHPPGDRPPGNVKSEHKQLAMNARRSPGWVVSDHPEDAMRELAWKPVFFQSVVAAAGEVR